MSPIDGVSDVRRLPRLGKIRLGIIKESERTGNPYPVPTDYFVCPEEVAEVIGECPKQIPIMFPVEDKGVFAPQFLKCYSFSQGLICRGDGKTANRKIDTTTGAIACHTTEEWVYREVPCDPDTCPESVGDAEHGIKPQCRRVMSLLFFIPSIPGLGVWQLDTSSFNSIVNLNSSVDLIRTLCGRISFIPLTLSLEPQEVSPPGIKKKTVHILNIRSNVMLVDIQRLGKVPAETVLIEAPKDEDEAPEDLFPREILATFEEEESEASTATAASHPPAPQAKKLLPDPKPEELPDLQAVLKVAFKRWGKQPTEVWKELGFKGAMECSLAPWDAYQNLKAIYEPTPPQQT